MADKLDSTEVKMGNLIRVRNLDRKPGASRDYYALKIENQDGGCERWCLFTGAEVAAFTHVQYVHGMEDFKNGRLYYTHIVGNSERHFISVVLPAPEGGSGCVGGTRVTVLMSSRMIGRAVKRAERNPEDVPAMSWLQDLRD